MPGICGSSFVLLAWLCCGWLSASSADLIMPSHAPGFTGESVPERTFTHGSLELLDRYEATFAIHDLQLMGAWNDACSDASHGPTSMVPERLFTRLSTSLNGPLVSNGFFSNPFTIVHSNLWHQIQIVQLMKDSFGLTVQVQIIKQLLKPLPYGHQAQT